MPDTDGPDLRDPDPGTAPSWRTRAVASTPPPGRPLAPPAADLGHVGPYRLVGVLGQGGMGVVYRGEDPALRRHVAIKVLLPAYAGEPEARERFLREARAQAAVEHDHIAAIHSVGEADGTPYLVMPLLKGRTLAAALARDLRPPLAEVLRVGREVAEGLAAAHERGLVHRDIKPGNVWLEAPSGRVKILDFGLARVIAEVAASPLTAEGMTVGTVEYMAPEQARGQAVDHRTDLFSLGVVLYQMTTGQLPFRGPNTVATLAALIETTPRPPAALNPDAPPELNALIQRLMAKDRARRPASAGEVAEALRRIAAGPATEALAVPPVGHPPPRARAPKPATKATRADRPRKESKKGKASAKSRRTPTAVWVAVGLGAVFGVAAIGGLGAVAGRALLGRDKEPQANAAAAAANAGPDARAGGHTPAQRPVDPEREPGRAVARREVTS